jgi:hypothetical protein
MLFLEGTGFSPYMIKLPNRGGALAPEGITKNLVKPFSEK